MFAGHHSKHSCNKLLIDEDIVIAISQFFPWSSGNSFDPNFAILQKRVFLACKRFHFQVMHFQKSVYRLSIVPSALPCVRMHFDQNDRLRQAKQSAATFNTLSTQPSTSIFTTRGGIPFSWQWSFKLNIRTLMRVQATRSLRIGASVLLGCVPAMCKMASPE